MASHQPISILGVCPTGFNCLTPTSFQMKILAAYVVEDIDPTTSNNIGQVGMVWLNPKCSSINDCKPSMVDYSDLTDPAAFNSELNSQNLAVNTYWKAGGSCPSATDFCIGGIDLVPSIVL